MTTPELFWLHPSGSAVSRRRKRTESAYPATSSRNGTNAHSSTTASRMRDDADSTKATRAIRRMAAATRKRIALRRSDLSANNANSRGPIPQNGSRWKTWIFCPERVPHETFERNSEIVPSLPDKDIRWATSSPAAAMTAPAWNVFSSPSTSGIRRRSRWATPKKPSRQSP